MLISFYKTTIGKKVVAAITGLMLYGFVVMHMLGNLKVFGGFDEAGIHKIDIYGAMLRNLGSDFFGSSGVLWIGRIGLIFALFLHIFTVTQLTLLNKRSRSSNYKVKKNLSSTLASRIMPIGGLFILLFIIVHLLQLTFGNVLDGFQHGHVYNNLYLAFKNPINVLFYLVCLCFLGFHMYHGVWSMFQTLGLDSPNLRKSLKLIALASGILLPLGFVAIPLAIFLGFMPEPSNVFLGGL